MAKLVKSENNPTGARMVNFEASDPAFVALVALGPYFPLRDLREALSRARVGSVDAASLVEQARVAGLVQSRAEFVLWDLSRLHQASLQVADCPKLREIAGLTHLSAYFIPSGLRSRGARLAFYLNDEELFRKSWSGAEPLIDWFRFSQPDWVASRRPALSHLLEFQLAFTLIFEADLSLEWQRFLSLRAEWDFPIKVFQGDLEGAGQSLGEPGYAETLIFLRGEHEKAHRGFQKLIQRRKRGPVLHPLAAPFAQLAALRCGDIQAVRDERYLCQVYPPLQNLLQLAAHRERGSSTGVEVGRGLGLAFAQALKPLLPSIRLRPDDLNEARQRWQSQGLRGLLLQLQAPSTPQHWGFGLGVREDWELLLSALKTRGQLNAQPEAKPGKSAESLRLVWHLDEAMPRPSKEKQVREEWRSVNIAWKTLMNKPPDFLSEQDRVVLGKIRRVKNSWGEEFVWGPEPLRALVGHPHLFRKGKPCQLEQVPLQIKVIRQPQGFKLESVPPIRPEELIALFEVAPQRMGLCEPTPAQQALLSLIQPGLSIPHSAQEQLLESLSPWMDKVELCLPAEVMPEAAGSSQVVVRVQPLGSGLRFDLGVRPAGPEGPFCVAGEGAVNLSVKVHSKTTLWRRDFGQECLLRQKLWHQCPGLQEQTSLEALDLREALEILLQLQESGVQLEWPAQKPWKLKSLDRKQGLSLRALQDGDWFEIRGQVQVDKELQLEVQRLLELTRAAQGRFIALGDSQFLALTAEMKQRLSALDDLVEVHKKKVRLNRLAVATLAELGVDGDEAFRATLEQFQQAESYTARLPGALQAELRDYQIEGYRWMARRARAGAGCCLADDMGLGKTLQALALLVKEARQGAHLVVCPTSVCGNWISQIERFAPTLQVVSLEGKQRAQQLAKLQPGMVALCSYRILLQDVDQLKAFAWNAVVLDEAQFIKNPDSKTARAAFSLQARVRLATTGTPIENRLLELWSIFNFLNPGLLGGLTSFQKRFETASQAGQAGPRQRLRRLVAPFLLRRTKSQVLEELPERTDIRLDVELSPKERALYEELRRQALASAGEEQGHLQLLAHLTRLRQACCHPRLVQSQPMPSSKLETFLELAEELRDGRHRTLVFSQFVELLQLLRQELDQRGWSYLYLDGSTPAAQRPALVDEFQEGETDFFLISLKAGGTGLNLTAADYVVHLDPWWNPAAEDQASDRAHRIGQTRPVTVYRLVAKDTLEEKVLQLHAHKRQLAQQILEGSDAKLRLNARELIELLRQ